MKLKALALLLVIAAPAGIAFSAPLAEKLPGGAVAYAGWAGRGLTFDGSMLGQLLQEPDVGKFLRVAVDLMAKDIPAEGAAGLNAASELFQLAWQRPIGLAVYNPQPPAAGPEPTVVMLIDLGDQRDAFAAKLDELIATIGDRASVSETAAGITTYRLIELDEVSLYVGYMDQVFFVCNDPSMPATLSQLPQTASLAVDETFVACHEAVTGEDEQLAVYVDIPAAINLIEKLTANGEMAAANGLTESPQAPSTADALGLGKLTAIASSTQIRQRGLANKTRLFTPGPHKGLLMALTGAPLTEADLAGVPADAIFAGAIKLDPTAALNELRVVAETISPDSAMVIEAVLESLSDQVGISIEQDLLSNLGDTWVLASAPSYGGFLAGTVLSVDLADEAAFTAALAKVEQTLAGASTQPAETGPSVSTGVRLIAYKADRTEIRYLVGLVEDMPIISPAWCVHNGRFYLALWPQVLESAVRPNGQGKLTAEAEFVRVRGMVSPAATAMLYVDNRAIVRATYPMQLIFGALMRSLLTDLCDQDMNIGWPMALWKLDKYASGQISIASADATGITLESYGSSPINAITVLGLTAISRFAESHSQFESYSEPADSAANLRTLGVALDMYAIQHNGQRPYELAELLTDGIVTPATLVSPAGFRPAPEYVEGEIVGEIDYVYISLPAEAPGDLLMVYERPDNYGELGTQVLLNNGAVEWLDQPEFLQRLEQTRNWLDQAAGTTGDNDL